MARTSVSPTQNKLSATPIPEEETIKIAESRVNGGLVTEIDPADIQNSQFQVMENMRVYADKTIRSPGKVAITPTKPDSVKIMQYMTFDRFAGTSTYIRFTKSSVYKKGVGSWTAITGTLTGGDYNRIRFTLINDRLFFTNGVDNIKEVNTGITAFADLGDWGKYKYIWGFANRLLAANSDSNPILLARSGDLNFGVSNPATDQSAGSDPLVISQEDYSDPITGGFGFATVSLVLREKSLWVISQQPSSTAPFSYAAIPSPAGCDCPDTAAKRPNGITWYDYRTNNVYSYEIGSRPEPIGTAIRSLLKSSISDKRLLHGSYDFQKGEYVLTVPSTISNQSLLYCYNFETGAWYIEKVNYCMGVYNLNDAAGVMTIGDLVGTIGDLVGTIGSLVFTSTLPPNRFYGLSNGDILQDDITLDTFNAATATSTLVSKVFVIDDADLNVLELHLKVTPTRAGSISLYFSRDAGITFSLYKTLTFTNADNGTRKHYICKKNLRVGEYVWKLVSTTGQFGILGYAIFGNKAQDKTER